MSRVIWVRREKLCPHIEVFHSRSCYYNKFCVSTLDKASFLRTWKMLTLGSRFYWTCHTSSIMVVEKKGKGNLCISHQDREQCRLFSALTFPHKRLHHWEELGWCRSGNVSAILSHREHCRLTTLSRKTSLHSLREKNGEGRRKKKKRKERGFYWLPTMCKPLARCCELGIQGPRDWWDPHQLPHCVATVRLI